MESLLLSKASCWVVSHLLITSRTMALVWHQAKNLLKLVKHFPQTKTYFLLNCYCVSVKCKFPSFNVTIDVLA